MTQSSAVYNFARTPEAKVTALHFELIFSHYLSMSSTSIASVIHPGRYLDLFFLQPLGLPLVEVASALGIQEDLLAKIQAGQASVSVELALRLERVIGMTAQEWLNMQVAYDVTHPPEISLNSKPLESFYWGKPVASFFQQIPSNIEESACLVTCAFAKNGSVQFILSQHDSDDNLALHNCIEDHAITALSSLVSNFVSSVEVLQPEGFEYFKQRLLEARDAAYASGAVNLESLSQFGHIVWYEHYQVTPNSGETCQAVRFQLNRAIRGVPLTGEALHGSLSDTIHHLVRRKLALDK